VSPPLLIGGVASGVMVLPAVARDRMTRGAGYVLVMIKKML